MTDSAKSLFTSVPPGGSRFQPRSLAWPFITVEPFTTMEPPHRLEAVA